MARRDGAKASLRSSPNIHLNGYEPTKSVFQLELSPGHLENTSPTIELPYDEQVQMNAVDKRFKKSCRYIDEMSYSQQASEIGVRLDGHALLLQVRHRAPSVPGAATLRKKR